MAVVMAIVILGASAFGGYSPALDLASLAVMPAAITLAISALWLVVRAKSMSQRLIAALCAIPAVSILAFPPVSANSCASGKADLKVAWLNAREPQDARRIAQWIDRENPQIVGVAEVGPGSEAVRRYLQGKYGNWYSCLNNGRCSTVLYSALKPLDVEALARGDPENRRALSAVRMRFAGPRGSAPFDVIALHLSRPLPLGRQVHEHVSPNEGPAQFCRSKRSFDHQNARPDMAYRCRELAHSRVLADRSAVGGRGVEGSPYPAGPGCRLGPPRLRCLPVQGVERVSSSRPE
jgi:hypothetical protein